MRGLTFYPLRSKRNTEEDKDKFKNVSGLFEIDLFPVFLKFK